MYPVYIYEEGIDLPEDGNYFLVSGNGLWLHKDTGIVKAFVPVDNISVLQDLNAEGFVQCSLPKIPFQHVWRIKTFFKNVVKEHRSEASTTLYFNKETNEFKVYVPKQRVSHGSVNYKREGFTHADGMENFLCVGTIHSHCDFGAFHSGTDIGDEEDFDGLHCTFGHNNLDEFSISASIAVNGFRMKVDPLDVLEGIEPVPGQDGKYKMADLAPELQEEWSQGLDEWMSKVTCTTTSFSWLFGKDTEKFHKGDKVVWAGSLNTVGFKDQCGDGPFTVDSAYNGQVTVSTKVGLARFSEKLFKKV
jgi:hypothetical protein